MTGHFVTELESWTKRFSTDEYVFGTEPNAFLVSQAACFMPGQKVLAIADGEGRNGVWLAQQGLDVLSVDFAEPALAKARKLAIARRAFVTFERADLREWEWGFDRFDAVVAIFIQFANPNLRSLIFRRIWETLKPGGLVLLQGYRPEQIGLGTGGPKQEHHMYTETLLRNAFKAFDILHLRAHDSVIEEGARHRGLSALIDMVARKRD
ncbi:MAG TPA: class I SAM-dependent methyltransferase [Acetobacteraceae bacterium]|nr:class I SAM-dependent methyltransferase [Acetobacteraceae bacterium]